MTTNLITMLQDPNQKDRNLFYKVITNPVGAFSTIMVTLFTLVAVFARFLMPYDPNVSDYNALSLDPSPAHIMGTDDLGHDIFSRMILGTQFTLSGALLCVSIALLLGCTLGLLAGYFGGLWDSIGNWLSNILQALPGLVVLLAAAAVLGNNLYLAMSIYGLLLSPAFFRLMFVTVRGVRNELYVDAARVSGLSDFAIITRHVLGVVRAPIIIQSGIVASISISIQSGLQFLGFGSTDTISWGSLLMDGFANIWNHPVRLIWPSVGLALLLVSIVLFATTLRDELERSGTRVRKSTKKSLVAHRRAEASEAPIIHTEADRNGEEILSIKNLEIGYLQGQGNYKVVVHDANLSINKGEVVGLVGESGSGKTQTALALLGLLPQGGTILGGSIEFDGKDLAKISSKEFDGLRGRRISYIPQEPMSNLDPSFTIGSQMVEPLRVVMKLGKVEAKARALELLAMVGLPNPEKTFRSYPHEISGGQAQRVLIAKALSCGPELIIADEPTTALDVTIQAEILDVLRDLQKRTGVAILLVTHNFGVVADLCDRVAVMQHGRVIESGGIYDIFDNAKHSYTRELLGAILDENGPAREAYELEVKAGN
jgi:ABC-type dipeptide/oligopeptide/nickel transport system ATPase component/ABC-type dipeptide/oligopeptide/nickel transport system permease subunit